MTSLQERWKEVFRSFNKKATPSRCAIVEVFEEKKKHLSAEEVYECLKAKKKKIGIATVYRNLDLLLRMGVLRKVNFGDGKEHYEMARQALQHHHLICTRCKEVIDCGEVGGEVFFESLREDLARKYHFLVASYHVYFYGLCPRCQHSL
ncbi:MAG: transcriptional repressor [Candidatus Caldatribacterium sp.]|nr:transcriptional repressor [Candidatus Caldatribacterium sp.]MCX7729896.1 transcriptional repressor [Candidatus Caldatribacterium sp.]MDW8080597.1 transcriptional repressor [Candidatus Calescibacterium sp.]